MPLRRSSLLVLIVLTGCSYITQNEYEEKLKSIDEDHDGQPRAEDCNDLDPEVFKGALEIPYNGIDEDCNKIDLVDLDGDGFPGITLADYEALEPLVPFPDELREKALDCADDLPQVYPDPEHKIEVFYDAIDGDCQKDNDFDADGDGFMPDTILLEGVERPSAEVFDVYIQEWGIPVETLPDWAPPGHARPEPGDCDDLDATVHPENALDEVFYDGIDRDCDHHNDFDKDSDCFMPAGAAGLYEPYIAHYYGVKTPPFCVDSELPFGDCLDEEDLALLTFGDGAPADPSEVHPNTAQYPLSDTPYDWIDSDCARDNDFDGDSDGFMPDEPGILDDMQGYAEMWGYEDLIDTWTSENPDAGLLTPATGDCDDNSFSTWPFALEFLGDGIDQDCQGDIDTAAFGFGDIAGHFNWVRATNPEITRLNDDYLVLVGAESGTVPTPKQEFGVALTFDVSGARGAALPIPLFWKSAETLELQQLIDIASDPAPIDFDEDGLVDPLVHILSINDSPATSYTSINLYGARYNTSDDTLFPSAGTSNLVTASYDATSLDMVIDGDGNPFSLACSQQRLHTIYGISPNNNNATTTAGSGDACFFQGTPALETSGWEIPFELCDAGACEDWLLTQQPAFTNIDVNTSTWSFGDQDEGWISLINTQGDAYIREIGGSDERVFPGDVVTHLDVSAVDDVVYAAAVITGTSGPEVWLEFGPIDAQRERIHLRFDDPDITGEIPASVAVFADADRVAVAVTAQTADPDADSVGWVFLGPKL